MTKFISVRGMNLTAPPQAGLSCPVHSRVVGAGSCGGATFFKLAMLGLVLGAVVYGALVMGCRADDVKLRGGAAVARQVHTLEVAGSSPAPATNLGKARP